MTRTRIRPASFALALVLSLVALAGSAGAVERWINLGKADLGGQAVVDVGGRGPFDAVRVKARGGQLTITKVEVAFADGTSQTFDRRISIPAGEASPAFSFDDQKDVQTVTVTGEGDGVKVDVQGLVT